MKGFIFNLGCMAFCAALASLPASAELGTQQNQQDCSKIKNKFWREFCEASQASKQNQVPQNQTTSSPPETSQQQLQQDAIAGKIPCNDPRVLSLPAPRGITGADVSDKDANFIGCVAARLLQRNRIALPQGNGQSWLFTIVHNTQINSATVLLRTGQLAVTAYDSMAQFLNYDPDEEAFIIGHEIGHVQDWQNCQNLRAQKVSQALILKEHALTKAQQTCEENADYYGLQYAWGAGFNPYAAGALMGRLQMYLPDQTRGLGSIVSNFTSDHPISSERTKKLRDEMIQLCSQSGTVCRP
jgi:Zn-dependent protease with chaperone function